MAWKVWGIVCRTTVISTLCRISGTVPRSMTRYVYCVSALALFYACSHWRPQDPGPLCTTLVSQQPTVNPRVLKQLEQNALAPFGVHVSNTYSISKPHNVFFFFYLAPKKEPSRPSQRFFFYGFFYW